MKLSIFGKKKKAIYNPAKNQGRIDDVDQAQLLQGMDGLSDNLNPAIPETQFKLGIKESALEPVYKVRRSISKIEITAEAIPFWKSTLSVITFTISIITLLIFSFLIYYYYPKFPGQMPLFYDHGNQRWVLYDKIVYLGLPILLAFPLIVLWRLNYSVFFFDRRLALVVTWIILLFCLLALIGISETLSLILI